MAILAIVVSMVFPIFTGSMGNLRLSASARDVQSELQTARLKAVSANRPMRVWFNCPVEGQFRMVELIGTPAAPDDRDSAADRCDETAYPYAPADHNPLTRPNNDGPVRRLRQDIKFQSWMPIEFWPDGTAHASSTGGAPWPVINLGGANITLIMGSQTKTITVNGVGKVHIQ